MYCQDLENYIKKFKMDLQEVIFDEKVFCEELRTQKLKVAKLEEQNLEIPEICQELKDSRTMVHAKDVETRSLERNFGILKDVTRDFASTELIWQKNWKRTSMIGRSHWRHETRLDGFDDFEDLLTFRRPNPSYIPMLDATNCELSFV